MNKKFQKIMLLTTSTIAMSLTILQSGICAADKPKSGANNLQAELKAYTSFQAGFRSQNHLTKDEKNLSANHKTVAFFNDAALFANLSNETDNNLKYGGKIILVPTAKRKAGASYNGTHLFVETEFGKFEAGSPMSAANKMYLDAGEISAATGGDWDNYAKLDSKHLQQESGINPSFASFAEFFLDNKLNTINDKRPYSNEPGRRISFYTPNFEFAEGQTKIQVGVSYTPDSSNTGADSIGSNSNEKVIKEKKESGLVTEKFEINNSVKDAIAAGVSFEQNFSDGVDLKVGVTGEYGKAAGKAKKTVGTDVSEFKLSNLSTYNVGAVLNIGTFSYAASYGSLGKSLTTKEFHKTSRKTDYYSGAVAYKQGPFNTSLTYFRSNQYKNTIDAISLGADYLMVPGFKPYAEITSFNAKGKPEYLPNKPKKSTRGTVALIGAKLSL